MKGLLKRIFLFLTCFLLLFLFLTPKNSALSVTEEECKQKENIDEEIACWESLLNEEGARKLTLQSEIDKFNTSIALTIARITQTVAQINELEKEIAATYPLRRIGKPEDIAKAVIFFASDQADWITGQVLHVGGGNRM